MDTDRVVGAAKTVAGRGKDAVGTAIRDAKFKAREKARWIEGALKAQNVQRHLKGRTT